MRHFGGSFGWGAWLVDMSGVIRMDDTDMAVVEGALYLKANGFEIAEPLAFQIPVRELEGLEGEGLLEKLFTFYLNSMG